MNKNTAIQKARTAADLAYRLLRVGKYKNDEVSLTQGMLAARIADGLHAVVAVIASPGQAHADTIVRSMIEALGDMHNLAADASYLERLRLTSAHGVKTAAEGFLRDRISDPTCSGAVDVAKQRCEQANETIRLLSKGGQFKRLRSNDRTGAPGFPSEVQSIYGMLCSDAHNDLEALRRLHFRDSMLRCGSILTDDAVIGSLFRAVFVVSQSMDIVSKIGNFDADELNAVWASIASTAQELFDEIAEAAEKAVTAP